MSRRVLYLMANAVPGGAERATMMMMRSHDHRRYEPSVLFFSEGPLVQEARQLGIQTQVLSPSMRLRRPFSVTHAVSVVASTARTQDVSLIHSCMGYAHLVGGPAATVSGTPGVLYQHGPVGGWIDGLATVTRCDLILTNSHHTAAAQRSTSWRQRHVSISPLAVDISITDGERGAMAALIDDRHRLRGDDVVIGMIARFDPQKGIAVAIRAVAPLLRDRPGLKLLIVGGQFRDLFPGYDETLRALARQEQVEAQVVFAGYQMQVRPYLARMNVLVHASQDAEAFGLTIAEGMACGVPVVASRLGGVPELVEDRVNGLLHSPGNVVQLRSAVATLLDDEQLRQQLSAAGARTIESRYRPRHMMASLESAYDRLLDDRTAHS